MKMSMIVEKEFLKDKIEYFIYNRLSKNKYELYECEATELLTWNRLIIAFDLLYLELLDKNIDLAKDIYTDRVRATSLGTYREYGFEAIKNNIQIYLKEFKNTFDSVKLNGFNASKSVIPLAKDGSILNGSHRVACSIFLKKKVVCVKTELEPICDDYKNLFERAIKLSYLEMAITKFCEYSNNTYIAFLWPSQKEKMKITESYFNNVVYKKDIKLSSNGAFNLLVELYKHMPEWAGTKENNFIGIKQKLIECFPDFSPFKVIVFQSKNIEEVRNIKDKVRNLCGIGYSSIHITDTKEEAIRISKLLFNENGLHFLNYAKPYRYPNVISDIENLKNFLKDKQINPNEVVIDGSFILALYGIRKNTDIDILTESKNEEIFKNSIYNIHNNEIKFHGVSKEELLWNPKFYFEYLNLKFISLKQLYIMKKNRSESKDKDDCKIIKAYISGNSIKANLLRFKQYIFYSKIKCITYARKIIISILHKLKVYNYVRNIYRFIKKLFKKNKLV